jgi:hypothetical protein
MRGPMDDRGRFVVLTGFQRDRSFGKTAAQRGAPRTGPSATAMRLCDRGSPTYTEADE